MHRDSIPKTLRVPQSLYELFRDKAAAEGHDQTWILLRLMFLYVTGQVTEEQLKKVGNTKQIPSDIPGRR